MFNTKFQKIYLVLFIKLLFINYLFVEKLIGISEKFLDLKYPASSSLKYNGDSLCELCHQGWTLIDMIRTVSIDHDLRTALIKEFCNLGLNISSIIIYLISQKASNIKETFAKCYIQIGAIKTGVEEVFIENKLTDDYIFCATLFGRIQSLIKLV